MLELNARRLHRLTLAAAVLPALTGIGEALANTDQISQLGVDPLSRSLPRKVGE